MWLKYALATLLFAAQGCVFHSNGQIHETVDTSAPDLGYLPIGVPFLLGGHGSSVPLTEHLSLTAKHIAELDFSDVIAYHPSCDIALIEEDNSGKELPTLGDVYQGEPLTTYGYGMTGSVIHGKGKYYIDVNFIDSDMFADCPASITDAPVQSGMSGGGAFNEDGELVGIISGVSGDGFRLLNGTELGNERTTVFVSSSYVKGWLSDSVKHYYRYGENFFDDNGIRLDSEAMIAKVPFLTTPPLVINASSQALTMIQQNQTSKTGFKPYR